MNDKEIPHALTVNPDTHLHFTLTRPTSSSSTPSSTPTKCTMTLTHTSGTASHLAFKVKTTQPRRYLVRPNQGIIAPGQSETVTILLVEKDKYALLQSFDRLGQSGLDHSKDKFLVQSCAVDTAFAKEYLEHKAVVEKSAEGDKTKGGLAEQLTGMWNQASGGGVEIHNKKLQVRHTVRATATTSSSLNDTKASTSTTTAPNVTPSSTTETTIAPQDMTPEQLLAEITSLRRKYDELVSFSVNLTAERDILNNTLEQTKRDLSREMAARSALENDLGQVRTLSTGSNKTGGSVLVLVMMVVVACVCFLVGVKMMQVEGFGEWMMGLPVLGEIVKLDLGISWKEAVETVVGGAGSASAGGEL